jgi:hypothetical protein
VPVQELDDKVLHAMAAKRQEIEVETTRAKIDTLRGKLREATAKHFRFFPHGRTSSPEAQNSLQAIARLEDKLKWSERDLADYEKAAAQREIIQAQAMDPAAVRMFQTTTPDGRKFGQAALNADDLHRRLNKDYQTTGEIFAGGYIKPIAGPDPAFDGWLEANGEALVSYLAERGFAIKRDV